MSSGVPTSSIAERARAKWSTGGLQFIHLNMLGTIPWNRGRLGVSSFHVHEVVESIRSDGLSRHRYRDATVVRVPAQHLEEFRKFNRDMCDGDDQLPPFSAEMKYVLLTKNHLVHALKPFPLCIGAFSTLERDHQTQPGRRAVAPPHRGRRGMRGMHGQSEVPLWQPVFFRC